MIVHKISVPDFKSGIDPMITVEREVKRPFHAAWSVDLYTADGQFFRGCKGGGENDYDPSNKDLNVKLFNWWMNNDICQLPPGKYFIKSVWPIEADGYPIKTQRKQSNVFTVLEANKP